MSAGPAGARDAVNLEYDASALAEGESWRITGVEVLRVDIWDAGRPHDDGDWSVQQAIDPAALDWTSVTLPRDAYWAGQRDELEQRRAWMSFDFSELTPIEGMESGDECSWPMLRVNVETRTADDSSCTGESVAI